MVLLLIPFQYNTHMCVGWLCLRVHGLSSECCNVQKKKVFLKYRYKFLDSNCEDNLIISCSLSYSVGAKTVDRRLAIV